VPTTAVVPSVTPLPPPSDTPTATEIPPEATSEP
jgi:hypothetical protein